MMRLWIVGIGLALSASAVRAQEGPESSEWEARLTQAKGEVTVYTVESPDGLPAEDDMPLQAGDRIVTGEDGSAEVVLGEGAHVLSLRNSSDLRLDTVKKDAAELKLSLGSLLAKIQKLASSHRFSVRTPSAVAAVRGTEFGVEVPADKPEETHIGVFDEGKVEVSGEGEGRETLISNQETIVLRGRPPLQAYGLRRLARHRAMIRRFGSRGAYLRKHWKRLAAGDRLVARRNAMERMAQRKAKRLERLKGGKRGPPNKEMSERVRRNREKMEKVRQGFKKGRRTTP